MESEILKQNLKNHSPLPDLKEIIFRAKTVNVDPPKTSEILKKNLESFGLLPSLNNNNNNNIIEPPENVTSPNLKHVPMNEKTPSAWDAEIKELETYFDGVSLPDPPIKLNQCNTITDMKKFISVSLEIVEANSGKLTFLPALDMLKELKEYLLNNQN